MKKIPAFVRGMVVRAVEESCRKNGLDRVTVEELERIRARMPTPKIFGWARRRRAPPEGSGAIGAPRATAMGGPAGRSPPVSKDELERIRARMPTPKVFGVGAPQARPAGAERGDWGPASDGDGGSGGAKPPGL